MKMKMVKSITALILSSAIISTAAAPALASEAEKGEIYSSGYTFSPNDYNYDLKTDKVIYSDEYFSFPSKYDNPHLASASMAFAAAGIGTTYSVMKDEPEHLPDNAREFLKNLGFGDFSTNKDYLDWGKADENGSEAVGFRMARDRYLEFLKEYIEGYYKDHPDAPKDIKIWTAGYSRGGATVNLAIPYMYSHRDMFIPENVTVTEDDLYAYTYGTPSAAWAGTENENADKLAACNYVHNYYTSSDYTIMIAFPEWGFGKYGVNNLINLDKNQKTNKDDPEKKAQMLKLLNELAPETYKQYTDEPSKSKDPDTFAVYRFKDDGSFQTEPDPENPTGLPETLEGFTKDRLDRIRLLSDGRDSYSDNYQEAVMLLAEYLKGDYSSRPGDLITNFIGEPDLKLTCVMVALWYLVDRYMNINH